jgi:hypothetical protein
VLLVKTLKQAGAQQQNLHVSGKHEQSTTFKQLQGQQLFSDAEAKGCL